MTKRFGFTLAEVLITLGIIGVVAAMTIPTLISNTNGAQFKTAYKKALSTLNQAILMNLAMDDTDFSTLEADAVTGQSVPNGSMSDILGARMQSATDVTSSYFDKFAPVGEGAGVRTLSIPEAKAKCTQAMVTSAKEGEPCHGGTAGTDEYTAFPATTFTAGDSKVFSFADGTAFGFKIAAADCRTAGTANCVGFIDVNGATNPNAFIACDGGQEGGTDANVCTVSSNAVKDVFPVYFYGQTVEPATDAARAVLFGK